MIFKKKQKPIDRYWENEEYMKLHYLDIKARINESQKNLKVVDGGEYQQTKTDIHRYLDAFENKVIPDFEKEIFE